ncbi:YkvA family protein [Clostridium beijerinckii]|jgi:Uncharacterized conserved protein|uniref:DUF1232 domain-containing protein n=2 Tax=Clostridium beijerinckii TaxID=1520 RepID=A0AAE2RLA1_CLOBE|nr:DUF1232 domain-containing protein [Clostridium beijerinckii]ABR32826.1 protein of unknown function DUF1232 [Clostridium beijerinckii NCIMB 8052]AIU03215.1 hypothetical protein Cbs_0639 [Clostridium beijerinckii ATCC 35702]MBF7807495.1 DUF1232 domain-containing protein [Clostridium beijerinckii]NRT25937.1 uncharacterized membrane protein YkvA (DUF1232 family) [Clostridium beijerinckii]NRT66463.1 uncharacterized membrane protein YkvA (DUF1232 family) [Clostridium beijerinckii]
MNISEVKVKLTGNDILSIINEFVKVDGLDLRTVTINDGIILEGTLKKGINIDFNIKVQLVGCVHNKITVKIVKVKVLNVGFLRILRSFVIKQLAKAFKKYGIDSDRDKVIIDINTILQDVPYINLNISEVFMKKSEVWAEISNVEVSILGELIKESDIEETSEEEEIDVASLDLIDKTKDCYSVGRNKITNKLSGNVRNYKEYIFVLPDIASLIYRLLKDKRVSIKTKLIMSAGIAYVTVPVNIIPNSIPFIGVIDDIGVIFFVLNKIIKDIPLSIIVENWEGKNDILLVLKKGIEYLTNFTNAANIEKLYSAVEELSSL